MVADFGSSGILSKTITDNIVTNNRLIFDPLIKNIVATLDLGVDINLQVLAKKMQKYRVQP
jgi:TATA-box binding protein (TBP) (component of TFIID and TFIIIB)